MRDVAIDGIGLNLEDAVALSLGMARATLSDKAIHSMSASRSAIEQIIQSDNLV